ncbi:MAG: acyl carrier protein [Clostridiales bacterium]|nr:acyl carrier protein [Clostridiales bacterium]
MSVAEKVKQLIASQLNKSVDEILDEKEVVKDLGADSLDIVEMLMGLEEEFEITVPEEDAVNIKTVGDIIKLIEDKQ